MTLSGLATGLLLAVAAVYLGILAISGDLKWLETDAPPQDVLLKFVVLAGMVLLFAMAALVLTVSLAVVQFQRGPWWAVLGAMGAVVAGVALLVAGSPFTYAAFGGYMATTNAVGIRTGKFGWVTAATGLTSGVLLLAAPLATGVPGAVLPALALAVVFYGVWAVSLAISARRRPAPLREPLQPALQSSPGDRYNSPVPPTGRFRAP